MSQHFVDAQTCTRCGLCMENCPWGTIEVSASGVPQQIASAAKGCILCGHCEAVCPAGAVQVDAPRLAPGNRAACPVTLEPAMLDGYLRMRRSIRRYRTEPVARPVIEQFMDIVRYAPTGRNRQDVQWLMIHDTREVRRLTSLAVDWMRQTADSGNPLAARYNLTGMVSAWEAGRDFVCWQAPHLVIAHVNEANPVAGTNAIIALAHLDIVVPSFGLGTCWGGIFMQAVKNWEPLRAALDLPPGHTAVNCLMFGHPAIQYRRPPKRNPPAMVWR